MLTKKRSKTNKKRGDKTQGWGCKKRHRGAGSRGGRGNAGSGSMGDVKKPTLLTKYGTTNFDKKGFKSIKKKETNTLSIRYIEDNFNELLEAGFIENRDEGYTLDTTSFDKVLGRTTLSNKLNLICNNISASAKSSVEQAGGQVTVVGSQESSQE